MYCNKCGCECVLVEQIEHACMDCDVELPSEYPPDQALENFLARKYNLVITENDRAVLLSVLRYYLLDHDNELCSDLTRIVTYLENLN